MPLTSTLSRPLSAALTAPLSADFYGSLVQGLRASIVGPDIVSPGVTKWAGTNQGNWGENYSIDAGAIAGYGATVVRILIRWQGDYDVGTDSYSANSAGFCLPANFSQFMQELDWLEAQPNIWVIVAADTNYGAGTRGLGTADWNFFDTTDTANKLLYTEQFYRFWEFLVRAISRRDRILAWELLPEPMQSGSNASHGPILKAWYLALMNRIRAIDPTTPFLIGGRASYGINTMSEVLFPERNDVIYTADFLTNKVQNEDTIAADLENIKLFRDTNGKPVLIQQFGRNTSDDEGNGTTSENTGLTALNGGLFALRALNIPFTHWQYHQNSTNAGAYALWYKINPNVNAPDNWTPKTAEIASFTYHMGITGAALEAAAVAAATACGGELFYVKSDLSNVFQDSAGATPVTAVGQSIGRVNAVVGTRNLSQATSGFRPTLATSANGYAMSMLPASESWLGLSDAFFAITDTKQCVIAAGRAPTAAANRVMVHCGTSGSVVRFPFLAVIATDECQASWRGDDNVGPAAAQSTTLCDNRAMVATAWMAATNDKRVYMNGVQEGSTNTTVIGSIASLTRLRFGAATSGANGFGAPMTLLFVCKNTVTADQRRAIERWAAWLTGCPFRGAIPP